MNHKRARPRKQRAGSVGRPGSREGNGKERVPVADRCRVLDDLHDYIGDAMDQFDVAGFMREQRAESTDGGSL